MLPMVKLCVSEGAGIFFLVADFPNDGRNVALFILSAFSENVAYIGWEDPPEVEALNFSRKNGSILCGVFAQD